MIAYNTLIVLLGVGLLGASAGLIGSFAVLRRQALLGDALAHAALPGLCLGFLLVGERDLLAMLLGALASGLVGIVVVAWLKRWTRIREDAAIGIVLSVFFGAGIVLGRLIQNSTTVSGSKAGLDSYILGKTAGMIAADVALIAGAAFAVVAIVTLLFKELLLVSFDSGFARVQGWPAGRLDLVQTGLVAVVVVIGLSAVGVVMMAALLIIPGSAARFWTDRLSRMVLIAAGIGAGMGLIGATISANYDKMPAGPVITLVGTAAFAVSALAAPRRGFFARAMTRWSDRQRADEEELLRVLFESGESGIRSKSWNAGAVRRLLARAVRAGDVVAQSQGHALTPAGREKAALVVRRHRLWKMLIAEYPDLVSLARPLTGESVESQLPAELVADLTAKLRTQGNWPEVCAS